MSLTDFATGNRPLAHVRTGRTIAHGHAVSGRRAQGTSLATPKPAPSGRRDKWLAALALVMALGVVAGYRETIVRLAPASPALNAALGRSAQASGLTIERVTSSIVTDGARRVLLVEGELSNAKAAARSVPALRLTVRQDDELALYTWVVQPPRPTLGAGDRTTFRARLAAPPADGTTIAVEFETAVPADARKSGQGRLSKS